MRNQRSTVPSRTRDTWIVFLLVLALGGCQSTTRVGDRYYQNGRLPEAAAAYQVYLDSQPADTEQRMRTLLRLGVILAMPGSVVYDPVRSIETLDQLIREYPESSFAKEADLLRELQIRITDLEAGGTADRVRLSELEVDLAQQEDELTDLAGQLEEKEDQIMALQEAISPLRLEIRELIHELAVKRDELEQLERLKAIDLDQQPPQ